MKTFITIAIASLLSLSAFAQDGDLVLQGAKWQAKFTGYICAAFTPSVSAPAGLGRFNVAFENMTSDSTLDNGLIKATFTEKGKACRYSAIIFADNAASTSRLVQSKAYALSDKSECVEGKRALDAAFEANNYLYYGHPHNLAFMARVDGADKVCPGSQVVGINFVVTGRIAK